MRPATNDYNLIFDSKDPKKVIGISFGYDHTAEHEWGIKDLKKLLDIQEVDLNKQKKRVDNKRLGIASRKIQSGANIWTGSFVKDQLEYSWFYVGEVYHSDPKKIEDSIQSTLGHRLDSMIEKEGVATAWSGSELCFVIRENKEITEDFKAQIRKGNMFLGTLSSGLALIRIDKTPEEFKQRLLESDIDSINLIVADEESGIKQALRDKQKDWRKQHPKCSKTPWDYMALSPRWANEKKTEVRYWLNPDNQRLVKSGWYTIEDLQNWLDEIPNRIVSKENWPQLKWESKDKNFSMLTYEYPDFFAFSPNYHFIGQVWRQRRVIRGTPKSYDQDFKIIIEHILYLYYQDIKDQVEICGENLSDVDPRRQHEDERVFGFCEAMTMIGLGKFGACNTPKNKSNFSWLKDVLAMQAWFLVAKEKDYITDEDEEKFLKPLTRVV